VGRNKGFTPILLLVILVILGFASYLLYKNQTILNTSNWKTFESKRAHFTIDYPSDFKTEYSPEINSNNEINPQAGYVSLISDLGKIDIHYGLPFVEGKGGGCEPQDNKIFDFAGKKSQICMGDTYLSLLYAQHPQKYSEVAVDVTFNKPYDKSHKTILKILSTFKFTN
jgi:hypothetical protein